MQLTLLRLLLAVVHVACWAVPAVGEPGHRYLPGIKWEQPPAVTPGSKPGAPPSDAIVLFDGQDTSAWKNAQRWKIENGEWIVDRGTISTHQHFGDCQLHLEWSAPNPRKRKGQAAGNSGVFFMYFPPKWRGYEVQILDAYQNQTYPDGQAGAIYKQRPPMVNPVRPPGEWNTYDIFWTAPKFTDEGELKSPAYVTVVINGVLVQNHFELEGDTPYNRFPEYQFVDHKGPISLQDHKSPVRYRNIWVREIKPAAGERVHEPRLKAVKATKKTANSGKSGERENTNRRSIMARE